MLIKEQKTVIKAITTITASKLNQTTVKLDMQRLSEGFVSLSHQANSTDLVVTTFAIVRLVKEDLVPVL